GPDALATLSQIVRTVTEEGSPSSVGERTWALAVRDLQAGSDQGHLMPEVTLLGSSTVLTRQQFEKQFEAEGALTPFRPALFDAQALTDDLNVPAGVWAVEKEEGLSRSRVLVAYSEEMLPERLVRYHAPVQ